MCVIGAVVVVLGAAALISVSAFAFGGTPAHGNYTNAGTVASELHHYIGPTAGVFFAIVLLNASLIGAAAVTLATSYAFGDVFGASHSLHRGFRDAKLFYGIFAGLVAVAAGIVLIPGAPLGVMTEAVQALAGVLLPSATVFLLLLCNDREVLGPWVNGAWVNAIASVIVAVLVMLSMILVATTLFPSINAATLIVYLGIALVIGLLVVGTVTLRRRERKIPAYTMSPEARRNWTMPPLALLERPQWSTGRKAGMMLLRGYLVVAVLLLIVKATQLGGA